jgi:hypothetical protein
MHLPEIRNGVLLLLSSKGVEDVSSIEQKNQLRDEIREAVNKPLGIHTPAAKPKDGSEATSTDGVSEAHAAEPKAEAKPENKGETAKSGEHKTDDGEAGVVEVLLTSFVIQ